MSKKTWQQQMIQAVGEQLLSNEKLRGAVTREVLGSVSRAASKAAGSASSAQPSAPAARGDTAQQVRELWEHPAVQGAVKGGLKSATQQAQQWQGALSSKVRQRADERQEAQLQRQQGRGQLSQEAQDLALQLAQRRREREEQQLAQQLRQGLLAQAASAEQRRVLERVFESTSWLGGTRETLRYTQLLAELGGESAASQMALHQALWALAEQRIVAVSSHGEVQLLPDSGSEAQIRK